MPSSPRSWPRQAIASLREQTDNPITYLVITHPNPDKFNGAPAFQEEGAEVIASEATDAAIPGVHEYKKAGFVGMGMFTEETYPQQATVDETFTGTHTLELEDGKTVELSELSEPGVSSTQTVAFIPELNALIVGDLVHHKLHAWLEGGIVNGQATPTIEGWIADLQELETTFAGEPEPTVYGGRGEPAPLSEAVADQIAYLENSRPDRHRLRRRSRRQEVRAERGHRPASTMPPSRPSWRRPSPTTPSPT